MLELLASTGRGIITIQYSGLYCVEAARSLESFSNHKRPVTPNLNQRGILRNNSVICLKEERALSDSLSWLNPEAQTHVTYTRHLSLNEVLFRRPSEQSGLGFAGQHGSSLMCQRKYSQRHLMAINNIENQIGSGVGEGGRSALVHKQGNSLNFKADALQDNSAALCKFDLSFYFSTLFYCITHWNHSLDRWSLALSLPESRFCCFWSELAVKYFPQKSLWFLPLYWQGALFLIKPINWFWHARMRRDRKAEIPSILNLFDS